MAMIEHISPSGYAVRSRAGRHRISVLVAAGFGLLLTLVAFGLDAARGIVVQARLARAVDAAALAGGRVFFDETRNAHIQKFFDADFPSGFLGARPPALAIASDPGAGTLTVRGRTTVRPAVLGMLGLGEVTVEATSVVRRPVRRAETGRIGG